MLLEQERNLHEIPSDVAIITGKNAKIWLDAIWFLTTKGQFSSWLNRMLMIVYPSRFVSGLSWSFG